MGKFSAMTQLSNRHDQFQKSIRSRFIRIILEPKLKN